MSKKAIDQVKKIRMTCQKCHGECLSTENAQKLIEERDNAISRFEDLKNFCETELGWMYRYFRYEFLESKATSTSKTIENAGHCKPTSKN
jgi:hypothetical protein